MEAITLAAIVSTLIFKALEKTGESVGESFSKSVGQLVKLIREEFSSKEVRGVVERLEENPNEINKTVFKEVLKAQALSDKEFASKLQRLVDDIQSDTTINQSVLRDIYVRGSADLGNIKQAASRGEKVSQEAITNVRIGENLKVGDIEQIS